MDLDSPLLDAIDCTPDTKEKMMSGKRKASQLLQEGSPKTTNSFLKWRFNFIDRTLELKASQKQALEEANEFFEKAGTSKTELMVIMKDEDKALTSEKAILLSQRKSFEGDLNDVDTSKTELEKAYIIELRNSLEAASTIKEKEKIPGLKAQRLDRRKFAQIVHSYLGTEQRHPGDPDGVNTRRFCNVLGIWRDSLIKCAHIVPHSFHIKEMDHMFGSDEPPLTSRRNGLSLYSKIEEAFDNCWLTIVPLDSVAATPTNWKIVLLNPAVKDNLFYLDYYKLTDQTEWRWRDIDGRKLTFLNDNRPARRFLYMRYILAWLHAEDKGWEGFKDKVPSGQVWASPNKPEGYLRKSILLELGKRTGDRLPQDLIRAGGFEDAATSSAVYDTVAAIRVTESVQRYLDGERGPKEREEGEESEEEDEEGEGLMDD